MSARKHDLTEGEFRVALAGEIRALLLGKRTKDQVELWLRATWVSGAPLSDLRIRTFLYALSELAFGLRADPGEKTSRNVR